ncbi:MAG TPA: DUF3592 domain-containing protein [Bacteroidales bacterium]|nr:DUF3592 domain-containing protein [Bacteroidales bacterium]
MTISLNRSKILIIAIITVFAFLAINRIDRIRKSTITTGKVSGVEIRKSKWNHGEDRSALIQFEYNGDTIHFRGEQNVQYELEEEVRVVFQNDNPNNAKIYSFAGFWLAPLMYCIIPLWLLSALVLSLFDKSDKVIIKLGKRTTIVKQKQSQSTSLKIIEDNL